MGFPEPQNLGGGSGFCHPRTACFWLFLVCTILLVQDVNRHNIIKKEHFVVLFLGDDCLDNIFSVLDGFFQQVMSLSGLIRLTGR